MKKKIFFSVGEVSGDRHGGNLAKSIKNICDNIDLYGLGGSDMRNSGVDVVWDICNMSTVGITGYLKYYKPLKKIGKDVFDRIKKDRPDLVILIDLEGFNLSLLDYTFKLGIPTVYFITPQAWQLRVYGNKIVNKISNKANLIFPIFEEEYLLYKEKTKNVHFLGHPLVDRINNYNHTNDFHDKYNLNKNEKVIGILPGSRVAEIKNLLPLMMDTIDILYKNDLCKQFILPVAEDYYIPINKEIISKHKTPVLIYRDEFYNLLSNCDLILTSSGTVTLEAALLNTPMIITYKTSYLTWCLGHILFKKDYIGLPNILSNNMIVPEILQSKAKAEVLANTITDWLNNPSNLDHIKNNLRDLSSKLRGIGLYQTAADTIINKYF